MGLVRLERTKESFQEKISNQTTSSQRGFMMTIENFESFSMEKHGKANIIPDMKQFTEIEDVFDVLQAWINWNNLLSPSTVKIYFSRLKKYLHYMGIKLNDQDIKNELDFKHHIQEELYGLTLEDIQKIFKQLSYKNRVQFMCQMSGLMRIGEVVQIKKKNLMLNHENIIVKIPASITKGKKARTTFFSREASRLLRPRLRGLSDEDLVFGTNPVKDFAKQNSEQSLRRVLAKVGLNMRYESTDRFYINTHSFRAYGITKISRHDPNFAKKLAGQKGYLLQYDRISDEEKLELYQKYELDLIVDNTVKLKADNAKLAQEKNELEKVKMEKTQQKEQIDRLTQKINEIKTLEEKVDNLENFKDEMRQLFKKNMGELPVQEKN